MKIKADGFASAAVTLGSIILIAAGWILRLRQYFQDNSLWLDEAMLALNIIKRSFITLLQPLDYNQGAPPVFLWLVKSIVLLTGNNEYSLRLIPLCAGCLVLIMIWLLSKKVLSDAGAIFALVMAVFGKSFISYSVQIKQYSVDAALTLFLYIYCLKLLQKELTKKDLFLLTIAGVASAWLSHTALFTLPSLMLVLIFSRALTNGWKAAIQFFPVIAVWIINFINLYFLVYSSLNSNQFLINYWDEYFLPLTWAAPAWVFTALGGLFYSPGELVFSGPQVVIVIFFLIGLTALLVKRSAFGWIVFISLLLTLSASILGKYPFGGRMVLFLVPGLLICSGEGLNYLFKLLSFNKIMARILFFIIFAYLAYSPVLLSARQFIDPKRSEDIAPTLSYLKANYKDGDVIYLYYLAIPAYQYYAPKFHLDNIPVYMGQDYQNRQNFAGEVDEFSHNRRVWLLFSHLTDPNYLEDRDALLDRAAELGKKKREFNDPGTAINLYLFDFSK